jgi:parvulin-like peptidyl-prolyl isomerase
VEAIIARVGDRIITRTQYVNRLSDGYEEIARTTPPAELSARREEFRKTLIDEMLSELLLKDRADRIGLSVTPQEVSDAIERLKAQNNMTSEAEFLSSLQKAGLTRADMEARLRDTLLTTKLFRQELRDRDTLDDRELRERYEREKEQYRLPERAHVREIVILPSSMEDPAAVAGAEEAARSAAQRVRGGEDFAKVAKEVSNAPTKDNGGDLGTIARGELLKELDDAVFAAPAGTVVGPVRSRAGFHVIRVEERMPSEIPSFDAVKTELRRDASDETFQRDFKAYVEKLRKDAFLEVYEKNIPTNI